MKRIGRVLRVPAAILALALGLGLHVTACGSDARATDMCKQIESARCARGPACIEGFTGDVTSCQRFYEVQCGRGVPESAKEPSRADLKTCLDLIKTDCEAVKDPGRYCPFLLANDQPAVVDTGVSVIPDMGTTADAPNDGG
jgi:hypothetical protein